MKDVYEQEIQEIRVRKWRKSGWSGSGTGILVGCDGWNPQYINHEDQIEARIPNAPDDLKNDVRQIVLDNRDAGANEHRDPHGLLWQFRIGADSGALEWRCSVNGVWGQWCRVRDLEEGDSDLIVAARAWFKENAPEQQLPLPHIVPSKDEYRWNNGNPEYLSCVGKIWKPWTFGKRGCEWGDRFLRESCPPDRFVMDDGRVFEFSMQDNGKALATCGESVHLTAPGDPGPHASGMVRALYKFRDAERARWTFKYIAQPKDPTADGSVVQIYHDGKPVGWVDRRRLNSFCLARWVWEKALRLLSIASRTPPHAKAGPDMIVEDEAHFTPGSHLNAKVDRVWHTKAGVFAVTECPKCGNPARFQQTGSDKGDITCDSCLLPIAEEKLVELLKDNTKLEAEREALKKKLEDVQKLNEELATGYYTSVEEREKARVALDHTQKRLVRATMHPRAINVNANVWVRLTDAGVEQLHKFQHVVDLEKAVHALQEGFYQIQLWELMRTFGPKMNMTSPQMFEGNMMFLEKPKSEDEREQDPQPAPTALDLTVGDINLSSGTFDLTGPPIADHKTSSGRPPEGLPAEKSFLLGANETQAWWVNLKWVWGSTYRILDVTVRTDK